MNRVLTASLPQPVIWGTKFLWWVRSMRLEKLMSRPGMRVNTLSRLSTMAFIRMTPRSLPMPNCMKHMAPRPEMVVSELPEISGMALLRAMTTASLASSRSRSSV